MSLLSTPDKPVRLTKAKFAGEGVAAGDQVSSRALAKSWPALPSRFFRQAILHRLASVELGQLVIVDAGGSHRFGRADSDSPPALITVNDQRFYQAVVLGGGLGAAEAYLRGDWDSPDLTTVLRVIARNAAIFMGTERGIPQLMRPVRAAVNWLRRNTRSGSKRNIAAHYDLSNEFFALMLDPTMTYSSGVFPSPRSTLEEASIEKYDRICRKLQLSPQDHVLEIGTGWGGFAEHAARNYGCRVTTTTISVEQHAYARLRFRDASLDQRITLLKDDYRDLHGKFDKIVSVEMIEAVGEKYLPGFFAKCSGLLEPDGMMLLQGITIPDCRYELYRHSVDFIQRYIFPGGFLPSVGAVANCLGRATDFRVLHVEDFGTHYARTLAEWRRNFWHHIDDVRKLGFDDRFIRTWHYYLCYCEAGFWERQIGVAQFLFSKPACRREPILM